MHIPLDRLEQRMQLIARQYGEMIGVEYAEPFVTKEAVQLDDIADLPVRSI